MKVVKNEAVERKTIKRLTVLCEIMLFLALYVLLPVRIWAMIMLETPKPVKMPASTFFKYLKQDVSNEQGALLGFEWLSKVYSDPDLRPSIDPNYDPEFQMVVDACFSIVQKNVNYFETTMLQLGLAFPNRSDAIAACTGSYQPFECFYRFARKSIGRYRDRVLLLQNNIDSTELSIENKNMLIKTLKELQKNWTDISDLLYEFTRFGVRPPILE